MFPLSDCIFKWTICGYWDAIWSSEMILIVYSSMKYSPTRISSFQQLQGFMGDTLRCGQVFACGDSGLHTDRKLIWNSKYAGKFLIYGQLVWQHLTRVGESCLVKTLVWMRVYAHMPEGLDFSPHGSLRTSCLITRVGWDWPWPRALLNHSWQLPVWRFVCV